MKFITITVLRANAPKIVREIESTGIKVVVTKNGKPVVLMRPISEREFELKGAKNGKG